jgi:outer membrane protein TolC
MAATRANRRAVEIQKQAEELKIASDARIQYYNWLRTVAGGAIAQSSLVRTQRLLEDAHTAFELGAATKADVMRLEAVVAATEMAIAEVATGRQTLEEYLATLMDEPVREYRVGEDVLTVPAVDEATPLDRLVAEGQHSRVELRALAAAASSLRDAAAVARVGQYPRLDAFGDFTYANPNQSYMLAGEAWNHSWALGLAVTWTMNDAFGGSAQGAELDATRAKLEADRKSLMRGIKLEVTSAYLERKKARVAIQTSAKGAAAAREAYRVAVDLYRAGRATTTDLISAESELVGASIKEINAAIDYHVAAVRLRHATGRDAAGS